MTGETPIVSIIMPTYNREPTLARAIDSVLRQDFEDWELVVVDDGSTDRTLELLKGYTDPRVRVVRHERNKGACAAQNTGLDWARGQWVTMLGSDDELTRDALSSILGVAERDPSIDAVTCNCVDSVTGELTGRGLERDQYLDFGRMVRVCSGEHWGLTKRSLIGDRRLNELIPTENVLWYRVGARARRFYLHRSLRVYHTEGSDRLSVADARGDMEQRKIAYRHMLEEPEYLAVLKRWRQDEWARQMMNIGLVAVLDGRREDVRTVLGELWRAGFMGRWAAVAPGLALGPRWALGLYGLAGRRRR